MTATNKATRLAHLENERIIGAVLDGIIVYRRPDTYIYRVIVRKTRHATYAPYIHWVELFWNSNTGRHWSGDSLDDSKSVGDEVYITWEAALYALRKLSLDLRLAAIP